MPNNVRLYGCGGAGTNIVANYTGTSANVNTPMANITPSIIDTSSANLRGRDISAENTYLIPDCEGSGSRRAENFAPISESIKPILYQLPPLDANIIVFSLSGGTGSVAGPLLVRELINLPDDERRPIVCIGIGSHDSVEHANNTTKTLQNLQQISEEADVPVILNYHLNSKDTSESIVDQNIHTVINSLALFFSGEIDRMDTRDVSHWIEYNKFHGKAQLATLHLALTKEHIDRFDTVTSALSVYNDPDAERLQLDASYHTYGFADLSAVENTGAKDQIHALISTTAIKDVYAEIEGIADNLLQKREASTSKVNITKKDRPGVEQGGLKL